MDISNHTFHPRGKNLPPKANSQSLVLAGGGMRMRRRRHPSAVVRAAGKLESSKDDSVFQFGELNIRHGCLLGQKQCDKDLR